MPLNNNKKIISEQIDTLNKHLPAYLERSKQENMADAVKTAIDMLTTEASQLKKLAPQDLKIIQQTLWRATRFLTKYTQLVDSKSHHVTPMFLNLGLLGIIGEKFLHKNETQLHQYGLACLTFSLLAITTIPDDSCRAFIATIKTADMKVLLKSLLRFIGITSAMIDSIDLLIKGAHQNIEPTKKNNTKKITNNLKEALRKEIQLTEAQFPSEASHVKNTP